MLLHATNLAATGRVVRAVRCVLEIERKWQEGFEPVVSLLLLKEDLGARRFSGIALQCRGSTPTLGEQDLPGILLEETHPRAGDAERATAAPQEAKSIEGVRGKRDVAQGKAAVRGGWRWPMSSCRVTLLLSSDSVLGW